MKHLLLSLLLTASAVAQGSVTLEKFYGETCDQAYNRLSTAIDANYRAGVEHLNAYYERLMEVARANKRSCEEGAKARRDEKVTEILENLTLEATNLLAQVQAREISYDEYTTKLAQLNIDAKDDIDSAMMAYRLEIGQYGNIRLAEGDCNHTFQTTKAEIEAARLNALQAAEDAYHAQLRDLYLWRRNCAG